MESSYFNHKARTKKFGVIAGWILLGVIAFTGFAFLLGYAIMLLWNWLMPEIFGLIEINYWQAVGIIVLAKILFGGFGHGKHDHKKKNCDETFTRSKLKKRKSGFSKWKHYDKFWKEKGESAFAEYVEKAENVETSDDITTEESVD